MENYVVDPNNGTKLFTGSMQRYKLYPYVLFGLAIFGFIVYLMWEVTQESRQKQTAFILDGITAATDELIVTLKSIQQDFYKSHDKTDLIDPETLSKRVKQIWKSKNKERNFIELENAMKVRSQQSRLVASVFLCRIFTLIMCIAAILLVGYFYILDIYEYHEKGVLTDQFSCFLPESYWYYVGGGEDRMLWKVTSCYIKPLQIYRVVSGLLLALYILIIIVYIVSWIQNVQSWKIRLSLLEYMPLHCVEYMNTKCLSDLHIILALVDLNGSSTASLRVAHEVMSALEDHERPRFLAILMELVDWRSVKKSID